MEQAYNLLMVRKSKTVQKRVRGYSCEITVSALKDDHQKAESMKSPLRTRPIIPPFPPTPSAIFLASHPIQRNSH